MPPEAKITTEPTMLTQASAQNTAKTKGYSQEPDLDYSSVATNLYQKHGIQVASTEEEEAVMEKTTRRKHPHGQRRSEILQKHPEIQSLFKLYPVSGFYTIVLVAFQLAFACLLSTYMKPFGAWGWLAVGVTAYVIGAIVDHALWVLIHDASHNLFVKSVFVNKMFVVLANIPHVFPSGILFRYYHILHHIELNAIDKDPDVPAFWEAKMVGNSPIMKGLWLAFFFIFQSVRMLFYTYKVPTKSIKESCWMALNFIVNIGVFVAVDYSYGHMAAFYLLFASISSVGLHPLGARWIQEHYPTQPFQATYSYYGPMNRVAFNIGFHNEHHDFPSIPWNQLPALKRLAPEYYDTLFAYRSYSQLLMDFIFERKWSLIARWEKEAALNAQHERLHQELSKKIE